MKHIRLLILAAVILLGASPAYPYWIWTPKTGKWVNPKTQSKSTPKEQLNLAKGFYDIKDYETAKKEFKKLIKSFPKSAEAAEAQFHLGLIEETLDNLYEAYQAYQKVVDKYPFSERITEIIEREFKLAEEFMEGKKRKSMGLTLPVENPAIEIFSKVVENSTYGPLAAKAQYKLGLVLKGLQRLEEAEAAFEKVTANYPDSEWDAAAKFQIASCRAAASKSSDYDQSAADEAKNKFQDFVRAHPDAVLSVEAQKNIQQLKDKESESNYNTGRFYEKQKKYNAAKIYYNDVVTNHPKTEWAIKSFERIRILERERK